MLVNVIIFFFFISYTYRCLWMTSSWWLVLRISLKMLVSSYLRLFVASTSVLALSKNTDLIYIFYYTSKFLEISIYCKVTLNKIPINWIFILFPFAFRKKRKQFDSDLWKKANFFLILGCCTQAFLASMCDRHSRTFQHTKLRVVYDYQLLFKRVNKYYCNIT